ncbi:unnamed protein product [Moneuplotes crassus]|uniref:Uncharacterized protein n=1 Tax=Euplotes crassus TaxID=5936 RepID=A0AAD1U4N9_EUPCR|nr:unnamed protein product [Moneuplotes crassus]
MKGKRRYSKAKSSKFLKNKEVILENYEEDEGTVSIDRDEADKKQINFKKVKLTKFIKQKKTKKKTVTKTKKSGPLKSYRVIINGATKKLERYKVGIKYPKIKFKKPSSSLTTCRIDICIWELISGPFFNQIIFSSVLLILLSSVLDMVKSQQIFI